MAPMLLKPLNAMKITEQTPIHYFIKDVHNDAFHEINMCSYLEIPQTNGTSNFQQMESIRLFISKDINNNEVGSFEINFGRNDCCYSSYKTLKELVKQQQLEVPIIYNYKLANQEQYLALRQKAFDIYLSHPKTDYSKLTVGSEYEN